MKRNDWIYVFLILGWSLLFYRQDFGLNVLLFDLLLIAASGFIHRKGVGRNWWVPATGVLLSGLCSAWYGNPLSVIANFFSVMLLASYNVNAKTSVAVALLQSAFSGATSFVFMFIDGIKRLQRPRESQAGSGMRFFKRLAIVLIALAITVFFFCLYRGANTLFDNYVQNIRIDFIPVRLMLFTIGGAILIYAFWHYHSVEGFSEWETKMPSTLQEKTDEGDMLMSSSTERFAGTILLVLLNLLLLAVNGIDAAFLFGAAKKLPAGMSYADFIHQGTFMLIVSIVFAMGIILFFFRGRMNFDGKARVLRALALFWVLQNIFLMVSAAMRNQLYIEAYALTYKRIGIYVWLLLSMIGVIVVAWKLVGKKTNAFIFRSGSMSFYIVLIVACIPDWDGIVARYNSRHGHALDREYLASLSCRAWGPLIETPLTVRDTDIEKNFHERLFAFIAEQRDNQRFGRWPSLSFSNQRVAKRFAASPLIGQANALDISNEDLLVESLPYLTPFGMLSDLRADECGIRHIGELGKYPLLQSLSLSGNRLEDLSGIESMQNIVELDISNMPIKDIEPLKKLLKLRTLYANTLSPAQEKALFAALPQLVIERHPKTERESFFF